MSKNPVQNLLIRSAVVKGPDVGYILAGDPEKESNGESFVKIFKWDQGNFSGSWANFDAHTACLVSKPEPGLVFLAQNGHYGIHLKSGVITGNIFQESKPKPKKAVYGSFRSVAAIDGKAYAVGYGSIAYRLDARNWKSINDGLPDNIDLEAIEGYKQKELYAVGSNGLICQYDGKQWLQHPSPTTEHLSGILCAPDGYVYAVGHNGILLCGRKDQWEIIHHNTTNDDAWGLAWFHDKLYVSTFSNVYRLKENKLAPVDFGEDIPATYYRLGSADGALWSIGEKDIMAFDGRRWKRVV